MYFERVMMLPRFKTKEIIVLGLSFRNIGK
jgi:hypothetical protein